MKQLDIERVVDAIMQKLDQAVAPGKMSKREALEAYEYMIGLCDAAADAIKADLDDC